MTDLRTEIQSAILDHTHEVRGVAALTDAIMVVVEKRSEISSAVIWSSKEMLLNGRDIYEVANQLGGYVGPTTEGRLAEFLIKEANAAGDLADEIVRLRQQLAYERNKALEDAAIYIDRIAHEGLHASMWRNKFKQASDAIRAMKDKP